MIDLPVGRVEYINKNAPGGECVRAANKSASCRGPSGAATHFRLRRDQCAVRIRSPVAVELPDVAHFADLVEIELGGDQFAAVARAGRDEAAARVAEVALPVEFADV